jgi:hypothetical protein
VIVPCASTLATLGDLLTNVVAPALEPVSVGLKVLPTSTMRIFSVDEPKPSCGATVTAADPLFPSLVAVMLADPVATPVSTPTVLTVATAVLSEDQAMVLPVTMLPLASLVVAVAWVDLLTPIVEDASDTDTVATAEATTVTCADPDRPSLVAVMLAVPAPAAVTTPVLLTVATEVLSDDHVTTRPVTTTPFPSLVVAVAWVVEPATTVEAASDTVTLTTGGRLTVTIADPLCPSLLAMMLAVPAATAVTTPAGDTVAMPVLSDDHAIARPVRTVPLASLGVAVAVVVWPMTTGVCPSVTERVATGGGPATPPPPPQPNAARHNTIAVRA